MARATKKACSRLTKDARLSYASGIWKVAVSQHPEFAAFKSLYFEVFQ